MASASSLTLTLGNGTRFTIESRPETETTAAEVAILALRTHSLIASVTTSGLRMLPSMMASRGSDTMA